MYPTPSGSIQMWKSVRFTTILWMAISRLTKVESIKITRVFNPVVYISILKGWIELNRSEDIQTFLASKRPFHETEALWADGTMSLRVRYIKKGI